MDSNLIERLKQIEALTDGSMQRTVEPEPGPEMETPVGLVPVPRRARVFLRHGEGHGTFAELTLAAPVARSRSYVTTP